MDRVAEIEIRRVEKTCFFRLPQELALKPCDFCIVEFTQGTQDYGKFLRYAEPRHFMRIAVSGKVLRKLTPDDILILQENASKKKELMTVGREKIRQHNLPLKLVDAEYSYDKSRLNFYYWAEGRIDFRRLVRDLAGIFNCRIEMRQIGLRDEARMKGGCGICGRRCCSQFLRNFESITMRMVKNQKLPMDMNKITGLCGRLLCCLAYEESAYKDSRGERENNREKDKEKEKEPRENGQARKK